MIVFLLLLAALLLAIGLIYTNREVLLRFGRWALNRRYAVTLSGTDCLNPADVYLVIPNHPAIVDPLIVVGELHRFCLDVRPLVDESFFSNGFVRHILVMFRAVRVPDFRHVNFRPILKSRPTRVDSVRRAQALGTTVLSTLTNGGNVLVYPSGHITPDGSESLDNRQLAFNIISKLPEKVRVLGVRTRGLYGSMWSRVNGAPAPPFTRTLIKSFLMWTVTFFRSKRPVHLHVEDLTARCRAWVQGGKQEFNHCLEAWYDADLKLSGKDHEEAT